MFLLLATAAAMAGDVAVPVRCTPEVNQRLSQFLASGRDHEDNVMVCGITANPSRAQRPGPHGGHQRLPLRVAMPDGSTQWIEVVTNDDLDGVVTAPANAHVFAYGQAFLSRRGRFVAGIHDVHCATHRRADNGWVVVNGTRYPPSCPAR